MVQIMGHDFVALNSEVGKIIAPQAFIDEVPNYQEQICNIYKMWVNFQPNQQLAWGMSVHQAIADWHGSRSLIRAKGVKA